MESLGGSAGFAGQFDWGIFVQWLEPENCEKGDDAIEATGNHPFWVVAGPGLDSRPDAADVYENERDATERGRWVEARDLQVGDELSSKFGTSVSSL